MDKKERLRLDCFRLAFRIYGKSYDDLEDSQAAGIARLAQGRKRFSIKKLLTDIFGS